MSEIQDLLHFAIGLEKAIPQEAGNPQGWKIMAGDFCRECMEGDEIRPAFFVTIPMLNRGEFRRVALTLDSLSGSYVGGDEPTARAAVQKAIEILKSACARPPERGAWRRALPEQRDGGFPLSRKEVFDQELPLATAESSEEEPLALIVTDIDYFKNVNDTYGHLKGDEVLERVAGAHALVCRGRGKAYRFGGDELVILVPNVTGEEATALAERLRRLVNKIAIPTVGVSLTLSVGIAVTIDPRCSTLFAEADSALYEAKKAGRNRVALHGAVATAAISLGSPALPVCEGRDSAQTARPHGCPADIPVDVFAGIRKKCEAQWPDDFQMRFYCETTQFDAYRRLHEPASSNGGIGLEATELLRASAEDGEIALSESDQSGKWLHAGRKEFVDNSDPAVAARYLDALTLLVKLGLARRDSGTLYKLTGVGFEKARALRT